MQNISQFYVYCFEDGADPALDRWVFAEIDFGKAEVEGEGRHKDGDTSNHAAIGTPRHIEVNDMETVSVGKSVTARAGGANSIRLKSANRHAEGPKAEKHIITEVLIRASLQIDE